MGWIISNRSVFFSLINKNMPADHIISVSKNKIRFPNTFSAVRKLLRAIPWVRVRFVVILMIHISHFLIWWWKRKNCPDYLCNKCSSFLVFFLFCFTQCLQETCLTIQSFSIYKKLKWDYKFYFIEYYRLLTMINTFQYFCIKRVLWSDDVPRKIYFQFFLL